MKIDNFEIPIDKATDFTDFQKELNLLKDTYNIIYLDNHEESLNYFYKNKDKIDLVVNFADNGFNNDLSKNEYFIELFNFLGVKYTGRQANNVELLERKDLTLYLLDYLEINYPKTAFYYPGMYLALLEKKFNALRVPVLVKVGKSGDSLTLEEKSICHSFQEVLNRIEYVEKFLGAKNVLLIQEFIENAREYTTFVLGNEECNDVKAFTVKVTPKKFYTYEQKLDTTMPIENFYKKCDLGAKFLKDIEKKLIYLKNVSNYKDYMRFDWLVDENDNFFLIDVNSNPAFDSELANTFNKFFNIEGRMLGYVINSALKRSI